MTELLYLKDSYLREFDACIVKNAREYVVLDKTAFYPEGGGQPSDTGYINDIRVTHVQKKGSEVRHFLETPLPESVNEVHGAIDWEPRYARMRMHTAQHLVSAIVLDEFKASTAGNQIHEDRSRVDFRPWKPSQDDLELVKQKFDEYVKMAIPVRIYVTTREKVVEEIDPLRRNLFERVPAFVKDIRVVEIVGVDKCPCAGTHVKNTSEVGFLHILGTKSKGAETTRLEYALESPDSHERG